MATCPNCGTNLDDVPVGEPCPTCGSVRRDATIAGMPAGLPLPVAIAMVWPGGHSGFAFEDDDDADPTVPIGQAVELTVSMSTDAVIAGAPVLPDRAWRRLEELATDARKLQVWVHPAGEGGAVMCEVMDEDGTLLAAAPGTDAEDAVLNVADVIAGTVEDGAG